MDRELLNDFDAAQREGFALLRRLVDGLEVGMSEVDIADLARSLARDAGFNSWFHPPEVQVGANTTSNAVWKNPSTKHILRPGDPVIIDLGPSDGEVYADVGTTVIFQGEEPEFLEVARECVRATATYANQYKTVGELFVFAKAWAVNKRLTLRSTRSIGHSILPKTGPLAFNYPRSAHAATWLRRYQVRFLNPARLKGVWAIRPLISDGKQAASFEEMILVDGDERRVLGRDSFEECGTL